MKTQFDHILKSSFYLWLDKVLMDENAFIPNVGKAFSYADDETIPTDKVSYFFPFKQWKWNDDYNTGQMPQGVYVNNIFVSEGTQGLILDPYEGRAIFNSTVGTGLNVSGDFSIKEINLYQANDDEENLLVNTNFYSITDDTTLQERLSGLNENSVAVPAAFLTFQETENEGYAIGGLDNTKVNARVIVVADNNYQLDGVLSIFRDKARTRVKLVDYEDFPFGNFWQRKSAPFTYTGLYSTITGQGAYIENVRTSKLKETILRQIKLSYKVGFVDFELSAIRYPRA